MAAYWIKDIALEEEFTDDILGAFDDASLDEDEDENIVTIPTLTSSPDDAERTPICLPSQFSTDTLDGSFMHNFAKQERKLQEGQANNALQGLWLSLCWKSVLYRMALWLQKMKNGKSHPQKKIQDADTNARHYTWDIECFVPWTKSDFLKWKKFNYISDFARCKKLRTKTDFDLVIVQGQNWERNLITIVEENQEQKLNMLLENNIILAVRQKRKHFLILSLISTYRQKWKTKSDFDGQT